MARKVSKLYLGIGAPLSGRSAAIGAELKQAVELAISEKNADGGLLGARICPMALDDAADVRTGQSVAADLCKTRGLLGVVGHYNSDVSIAASEIYRQCDLAMVNPIASNPELTGRKLPNVFRFTNRDDRTAGAIAQYLYHRLGKRRAVVVESGSAYGRSMSYCFMEAFRKLHGEILLHTHVEVGRRDFQAEVRDLPRPFDLMFYGGTFEGAYLLRAMREAGLMQLFAAGDDAGTPGTSWNQPRTLSLKARVCSSYPQLPLSGMFPDPSNSRRGTPTATDQSSIMR